mmetsp:Transcript_103110/g.300724  ORF Transcript_103110/g.300724 Transcript_103110/m.300724 type:complete len:188 (-) Transcript_103110:185-748(-)
MSAHSPCKRCLGGPSAASASPDGGPRDGGPLRVHSAPDTSAVRGGMNPGLAWWLRQRRRSNPNPSTAAGWCRGPPGLGSARTRQRRRQRLSGVIKRDQGVVTVHSLEDTSEYDSDEETLPVGTGPADVVVPPWIAQEIQYAVSGLDSHGMCSENDVERVMESLYHMIDNEDILRAAFLMLLDKTGVG